MAKELTAEEGQKVVDAMARSLGVAETATQRAMMSVGDLPTAVRDFGHAIGTHVSMFGDIHEQIGAAHAKIASGFAMLGVAHGLLNDMRLAKGLPDPGAEPLNGGGGGKP